MVIELDVPTILTAGVLGFSAFNTYQHTRTAADLSELKLFMYQNFVHRRDLAPGSRPRLVESPTIGLDEAFD